MAKQFLPSPQQSEIFRFVEDKRGGSAIVEAVAGAGKTTTLVKACERMNGQIALIAFNTRMAKELRDKTAHMPNIWAKTFHSFGMNALNFRFKNGAVRLRDPDDKKVTKLLDAFIEEKGRQDLAEVAPTVAKVVSMAKQRGIGVCFADTDAVWEEMIEHFDLGADLPETYEGRYDIVIKLARVILRQSIDQARDFGVIDFDDMIYLPLVWNMRLKRFPWVLVDECQPLGTLVEVPNGRLPGGKIGTKQVPIESLNKGDKVVSYNRPLGVFKVSGDQLSGVRRRRYTGNMYTIECGDRQTRYTENHWCWSVMGRTNEQFFVYMMRRGSQFRIGHCAARWSGNVQGLSYRLYEEKADAAWVLKAFDTKTEAEEYERGIILSSGIPGVRFEPNKNSSDSGISGFWGNITDNTTKALFVLNDHGRSLWYPLIHKGEQQERDGTRFRMIRACNLMNGMIMRPFRGISKATGCDQEIRISWEVVDEDVVSLEVENTNMYVGDGIATHNCQDTNPTRREMAKRMLEPNGRTIFIGDRHQSIFGFTGADNDSIDQIARDFNAVTLPLTVTYRCPKSVVDVARRYVSHITAHESAPEGMYTQQPYEVLCDQLLPGDAVLCRYTKFLVSTCFKLIRLGKPARIEGRAIGAGLIALARKWKVKKLDTLVERLRVWEQREVAKAEAKKQERKVLEIKDKSETMYVLIARAMEQGIQDVDGLCALISSIFDDDVVDHKSMITLCSVHRSKGHEWSRVFILGLDELMGRECFQPWQTAQERNLQYVAVTRAQELLVNVTGVKEEKKQHQFGGEG